MVTVTRNSIKVELEDIGEGRRGDFNPLDPEDIPLLRFTVSARRHGVWEPVNDASYCTLLDARLPLDELSMAAKVVLDAVYEPAKRGESIKKLCESLSWLDESDLTHHKEVSL